MVRMAGMEDHERKIVVEFVHLLEKSKQLFNGLRDLPQYGHKQWQAYFGRTFDIYTKLWKFQQQHRQILDTKYGLKRWQIGEIASKIGQLYYHYYLRTSETNYLNEAYSFYAAIRGRAYYSRAAKEDRSELMVKKLRYYARFIVVCLLLRRMKLVRELIVELDRHIADYTSTYEPDDQIEWSLVLDEIKGFIASDSLVSVLHADTNPIVLSHRLSPLTTPPVEKSQYMNLTLQEILIVGSASEQVKFSELTMDMFRMIQTLEREPQEDFNHIYDASPAPGRVPYGWVPGQKGGHLENGDRPSRRENPHKYLLYKPTLSQILVFLASGFKELPVNGALLLYLSADGCFSSSKHPEDMGYDLGGVSTTSKREGEHKKTKEVHCLYPGDLYPFTRRPLFVIVDSDNSFVFQHIPRYFGQPLVTLMSPQDTPPAFQDQQHNGSLFTLFLHSPLTAFCYCCNITSIAIHHWERCQSFVDRFVTEASRLFTRARVARMNSNSRACRMLAALNSQQRKTISNLKSNHNKRRFKRKDDADYIPSDEDTSAKSMNNNSEGAINSTAMKDLHVTPPMPNVPPNNLLEDINITKNLDAENSTKKIFHIFNFSATTFYDCCCYAIYSVTWCSIFTELFEGGSFVRGVSHHCRRLTCWNILRCIIWCSIWPLIWRLGRIFWRVKNSNDPGLPPHG